LANENRSRGLFPKIRSGDNLRDVLRVQQLACVRVRRSFKIKLSNIFVCLSVLSFTSKMSSQDIEYT
jgi:hypothetical protein